jgi:hypothetical protein
VDFTSKFGRIPGSFGAGDRAIRSNFCFAKIPLLSLALYIFVSRKYKNSPQPVSMPAGYISGNMETHSAGKFSSTLTAARRVY